MAADTLPTAGSAELLPILTRLLSSAKEMYDDISETLSYTDPEGQRPTLDWLVRCWETIREAEAALSAPNAEAPLRAGEGALSSERGLPMDLAPRDGTLVALLVDYEGQEAWLPLEDAMVAWTLGSNNYDNDGEDLWRFAGWNWHQDMWCEGAGKPIGWAPFDPPALAARDAPEPSAGGGLLKGEPRLHAIREYRRLHDSMIREAVDAVDGGWRPPVTSAPGVEPTAGGAGLTK